MPYLSPASSASTQMRNASFYNDYYCFNLNDIPSIIVGVWGK